MNETRISLRPPKKVKVIALLLGALASFCIFQLAVSWTEYTTFGHYLLGGGALVFFLLLLDALQRRYEIDRASVAMRVLFFWRTVTIPPGVQVTTNERGDAVLAHPERKRALLTIPKDYDRTGELANRLQKLFAA